MTASSFAEQRRSWRSFPPNTLTVSMNAAANRQGIAMAS